MPFNRVKDVKAMVYWLLIINKKDRERKASEIPTDDKLKSLVDSPADVIYYPGLMLIPMPEAGWCLGYIDVSFWACFLYVFGSVLYFVDTFYIWYAINPDYTDDAANPAVYINTMAAVVFVWNAIACILDWWVQLKQMGAMNLTLEDGDQNVTLAEIPHKLSAYYFWNNFFFMGAAVIYLIQAIWWEDYTTDLQNCYSSFCGEFWINIWGSLLYLGSSWFSVLEYWEYNRARSLSSTPTTTTLFTLDWQRLDWFGWGDWLFLATSIVAVIQVPINVFIDNSNDMYGALYMLENVLFLIDSLAYFIGYVIYMYELQDALQTGLIDAKHVESISLLMEHMEHDDFTGGDIVNTPLKFGSISSILSGGGGAGGDQFRPRSGTNTSQNEGVRSKTSFSFTAEGKVSLDEVRQKFEEVQSRAMERLSFGVAPGGNNSRGGSRGGSMSQGIVTNRVSFGGTGRNSNSRGGSFNGINGGGPPLSKSGSSSKLDTAGTAAVGLNPEFTVNKLYVQHEGDEESSGF